MPKDFKKCISYSRGCWNPRRKVRLYLPDEFKSNL